MIEWIAWFILLPGTQIVIAGIMGSLVRCLVVQDGWRSCAQNTLIGAILAYYAHPIAIPIIRPVLGEILTSDSTALGVSGINVFSGFMIGLGGMTAAGLLMDIWKVWRRRADQPYQYMPAPPPTAGLLPPPENGANQ